jgi:hypothetical protein
MQIVFGFLGGQVRRRRLSSGWPYPRGSVAGIN